MRAHSDSGVPHPEGNVDPSADVETIEAELLLSDLEQAERRIERVTKQARSLDPEAVAEQGWLERVIEALQRGEPVRSVPVPDAAGHADRRLGALTSKPVLFAANVDEGDAEVPAAIAAMAARARRDRGCRQRADRVRAGRARPRGGGDHARRARPAPEPGLNRLVRAAYELLGLITFFTAGPDVEANARSIPAGWTAWQAAGRIHGEIQQAFIRAEIVGWRDLIDAGGYAPARDRGLLRTEGRDYVVADGDVITIKV